MSTAEIKSHLEAVLEELHIHYGDGRVQVAARQTLLFALCGQRVSSHRDLLDALERMAAEPTAFNWLRGWYRNATGFQQIEGHVNVLAVRARESACPCLVLSDGECTSQRLFVDAYRALQVLFADGDPA